MIYCWKNSLFTLLCSICLGWNCLYYFVQVNRKQNQLSIKFFFFFFEEQKTFFWNPTYTLQTIAKINYTSQRTLPMIISPFVPSPLLLHYSSINCCWPIITSPSTFFQMTFFAQANHFYTIFFFFFWVLISKLGFVYQFKALTWPIKSIVFPYLGPVLWIIIYLFI